MLRSGLRVGVVLSLAAGVVLPVLSPKRAEAQASVAAGTVTVVDTGTNYVLSNGYLTASISKTTGDMVSLKVKGLETMGYVSGHHAGYWEQNPAGAARLAATVTIDPRKNGGERAEISIKGWADGIGLNAKRVGADPGAAGEDSASQLKGRIVGPQAGSTRQANAGTALPTRPEARVNHGPMLDMEIRYTLGKGERGIYTYAIFTHAPSYGATQLGESRYGFKLNAQVFDWLSVDAQRNEAMPTGEDWDRGTDLNMKEARRLTTGVHKNQAEHKYDYCADQFDTPAFGWSSTKEHVGLYFINPSMEYLSSGPQHFELTGHLDDGDGGDPTLLDYWRGTHYGGSSLPVSAGEGWTKVVGPIFVYVNQGASPQEMFEDAKAQALKESSKWPYRWVSGVDFPKAEERGVVRGQLLLKDTQATTTALPHLLVGLAYPDAAAVAADGAGGGFREQPLTWQSDAKHYEFWVRGTADGRFTIPKVRPGTYELHAIADGVLGEFEKASVTVSKGETIDLGKLTWTPVRYGQQVFQIGVPNRSASEFLKGDDHWHWGEYLEYSKLFPNDVDYTVGKSDFRKDWYIYQVPHVSDDNGTGRAAGRATTWTIHFDVPPAMALGGKAVLRMGLSGVSAKSIAVGVNGQDAGTVTGLVYNATINRDGVQGSWVEKDVSFNASLLHPGTNAMTLTVPAGGVMSGIAYDVVRLEVGEGK